MSLSPWQIEPRPRSLTGQWVDDVELQGLKTAEESAAGDVATARFERFAHLIPDDLTGRSVLDIGCSGASAMELKRRGARRVVAIDSDDADLERGRRATEDAGYRDIEFRKLSVYDVGQLGEKFDLVICVGVLEHLRHPLLALDMLYDAVVADTLLFQSVQRSRREQRPDGEGTWSRPSRERDGDPLMYFVQQPHGARATNWWVPNGACVEAMLRSAGFTIESHPEDEVYICRRAGKQEPEMAVVRHAAAC
jgi:tRNA (mo5U34)-methyltransferase